MNSRVSTADVPLHSCAAQSCLVRVAEKYLFCAAHWSRLPRPIQYAIIESYDPHGDPSPEFLHALNDATSYLKKYGND